MAGEPLHLRMPQVWGVRLTGELPDWVSAKDVILEMLRRHGVEGGFGRIIEYYGPGLDGLTAMDRHVIANMGAELGATTTVFPVRRGDAPFLRDEGREEDWVELVADEGATTTFTRKSTSRRSSRSSPSRRAPATSCRCARSPGRRSTRPTSARRPIPATATSPIAAHIVARPAGPRPRLLRHQSRPRARCSKTSSREGLFSDLVRAGARSTKPAATAASAWARRRRTGRNQPAHGAAQLSRPLRDPRGQRLSVQPRDRRRLGAHRRHHRPAHARHSVPEGRAARAHRSSTRACWSPPLSEEEAQRRRLEKTPNIASIPELDAIPDEIAVPVLLKVGDDISTDDIMPAGARVMPFWSNIPSDRRVHLRAGRRHYPRRARENAGERRPRHRRRQQLRPRLEPRERRASAALPRPAGRAGATASPASTGRTWSTSACCR